LILVTASYCYESCVCCYYEVINNVQQSRRESFVCLCVGDFAVAIETLVTAISLIKQSKIAADDRCKILISSLQDTLHGIESKSYGSKYVLEVPQFCRMPSV